MNEISIQRKAILDALNLSQLVQLVAVTLTMNKRFQSIKRSDSATSFRHFMNRLNRKVVGSTVKRFGKKLRVFPVMEANSEDRLHDHANIDRPIRSRPRSSIDSWSRTDFGYHEIDVQSAMTGGWLSYLRKARQKQGQLFEAIDWNNCTSILG